MHLGLCSRRNRQPTFLGQNIGGTRVNHTCISHLTFSHFVVLFGLLLWSLISVLFFDVLHAL